MVEQIVKDTLQQALVDLIELSVRGKQMHWNIRGKNFHDLHTYLDEVIDRVRLNYDEVAERLVAINVPADGRSDTVAKSTQLPAIEGGYLDTLFVYKQFEEDLLAVSESIKQNLDAVDEADHLSADVLTAVCTELEKDAWMLRSQII